MSFRDPNQFTSTPRSFSDGFPIDIRIILTAIIVILFVVILMVSLYLYSPWYLHSSRRFHLRHLNRSSRHAATAIIFFADPSSTPAITTRGIDPSVIKSLSIFKFSAATASYAIDCAVCLSEFKESESGRVLPNCMHMFHVECIDMWFHSHSSCPLCRSLVEPIDTGVKSAEELTVSISYPASRLELCNADHDVGAGTSENSDLENSREKPAPIEVQRRNIRESENDLTRSH